MKKMFIIASTLAMLITAGCASRNAQIKPGASSNPLATLRSKIDHILQDSSFYRTRAGIKIISLKTGETLYARNSHHLFHPASNMKLLTTAAALTRLGSNFKFKTILCADTASIADSVLKGNLYLKGFGNGDLTSDDLRWIVTELKNRGLTRVEGNLICDDTYFDDLYWGSGWMWDDGSSDDFAHISALTVNKNCVTITVKPGERAGDSLVVRCEPKTVYVKIEDEGLTVDSLDSLRRKTFNVSRKWINPENTIIIKGGRFTTDFPKKSVIEVIDPALYTGTLFKELLQADNINFEGKVQRGVIPDTSIVLVKHLSPPLARAVFNINKNSDNLSAELLLKTMGSELKEPPGSASKGIAIIHDFLNKIGVDSTSYRLADGSGVSRYNVISPDLIITLLRAMHKDFRVQAEFKTSLPIAGIDGTLKGRMKNTAAENTLRAKTGTLRGVSVLSGYTTTADGELLAFAMFMEHFVTSAFEIRQIQDRIGDVISSFSRHPPNPEKLTGALKASQ